jgi:hypothetical protein
MAGETLLGAMPMKTAEQFKDYCAREMESDLAILEKIRTGVHGKLIAAAALLACAGMGLLFWMQHAEYISGVKAALIAAGCILVVILVILGLLPKILMREYRSAYKMSVMDKFTKFLDASLQYDLFGVIPVGAYSMSRLFRQQYERYSGSDLVKGRLDSIPVEFSYVLSEYCIRRKGAKNWVPVFKGLFFVGDCRKNFSGQTVVLPDTAQNLLGKLGQKLQSLAPPLGRLVTFNDSEFENYFVVYSENENEARTILSPALMQKAVEFRNKNRSAWLRLSFYGSQVCVALSRQQYFCEPSLFGPIVNFAKIDQYLEYISFALSVVEEVNRDVKTAAPREIPIGLGASAIL